MKSGVRREIPAPGSLAPSLDFCGIEGKALSLAEILKSGPTILFFYKASCPICQFTAPYLERMYETPGRKDVQFFAVSQDDADTAREFSRDFGITFPTLLDEEERSYPASNAFGISHVPSTFLIDTDGIISWALDGFSKTEFEELGRRVEAPPFLTGEYVPSWKAG